MPDFLVVCMRDFLYTAFARKEGGNRRTPKMCCEWRIHPPVVFEFRFRCLTAHIWETWSITLLGGGGVWSPCWPGSGFLPSGCAVAFGGFLSPFLGKRFKNLCSCPLLEPSTLVFLNGPRPLCHPVYTPRRLSRSRFVKIGKKNLFKWIFITCDGHLFFFHSRIPHLSTPLHLSTCLLSGRLRRRQAARVFVQRLYILIRRDSSSKYLLLITTVASNSNEKRTVLLQCLVRLVCVFNSLPQYCPGHYNLSVYIFFFLVRIRLPDTFSVSFQTASVYYSFSRIPFFHCSQNCLLRTIKSYVVIKRWRGHFSVTNN